MHDSSNDIATNDVTLAIQINRTTPLPMTYNSYQNRILRMPSIQWRTLDGTSTAEKLARPPSTEIS